MFRPYRAIFLTMLAPLLCCNDRSISRIELRQSGEVRQNFAVDEIRDVDFLFVIDNSNSMDREQISLADKFSALIDVLEDHPDGMPSVHIAVVSTDLGADGKNGCSVKGDDGRFQGADCGLTGSFIKSIAEEDGSRTTNFVGALNDTFSCMATLGNQGCGFEQPLESMRRALGHADQIEGFLRPQAYLAVVFVTDEDDCSVYNPEMFDPAIQDLNSVLGPPKSFRCFDFGVECDEDPRSLGEKSNCRPKVASDYLYDIAEYREFLLGVKAHPNQIVVASIAGAMEPVEVIKKLDPRGFDYLALDFSCTEVDAEAVPPIRLNAFVDSFGEQSSQTTSICQPDLGPALADIAKKIVEGVAPCIRGRLADIDPAEGLQPDCVITETRPGQEERRLPSCDNLSVPDESTNLPCFTFLEDPAKCPSSATHLIAQVHYDDGHTVLPGTRAQFSCMSAE